MTPRDEWEWRAFSETCKDGVAREAVRNAAQHVLVPGEFQKDANGYGGG